MWPVAEEVWKSFWVREREEKQRRTRSLDLPGDWESALSERLMSVERSSSKDEERAQKHVTKRISYRADSRAGRIAEVYISRPLPIFKSAREISAGLSKVEGSLPQKCVLFSSMPCLAVKPLRHSKDSIG